MATNIPKGTSKEAIEKRKSIIRSALGKLKGKFVKCPCLGNVPVYIEPKSIDEVSDKAGLRPSSTKLALQLRYLIHNAKFVRMTLPKNNTMQKKKFQIIFMYELETETKEGEKAKLTIGVREFPLKFLQYCVTDAS